MHRSHVFLLRMMRICKIQNARCNQLFTKYNTHPIEWRISNEEETSRPNQNGNLHQIESWTLNIAGRPNLKLKNAKFRTSEWFDKIFPFSIGQMPRNLREIDKQFKIEWNYFFLRQRRSNYSFFLSFCINIKCNKSKWTVEKFKS